MPAEPKSYRTYNQIVAASVTPDDANAQPRPRFPWPKSIVSRAPTAGSHSTRCKSASSTQTSQRDGAPPTKSVVFRCSLDVGSSHHAPEDHHPEGDHRQ